ncbi:hypothetical protein FSZ31_04780 [Sphingorhabdus soli]|uniref:DUF1496 domain-containing protein n=1 Tax=Flavisphingopyxis soli TaxID=2601267 RepID=A0A5C6UM99_9SPHN|nr:hypothetical protein [Sphingorhabdus soli]TXC74039.1 hypothetical protein FSZ31_04780 [Sphingorhabdus soli]
MEKPETSPIISEEEAANLPENINGAQCYMQAHDRWYNDGETTCVNGRDHRCRDGRWVALGTSDYC